MGGPTTTRRYSSCAPSTPWRWLYRQSLLIKKRGLFSRGGKRPTRAIPPLSSGVPLAVSANVEQLPAGSFLHNEKTGAGGSCICESEGMVKDEECRDAREEEGIRRDFQGNWSLPKPCDACRISGALLYCRADSAYLCLACDVKVHGANKLASRHERVVMCEVCEQAPAVVTCKADAAALCVSCDADIHSANPLARRHERLPVLPFHDCSPTLRPARLHEDDHLYSSWLHLSEDALNPAPPFLDRPAGRIDRAAVGQRIARDRSTNYKLDMLPEEDPYLDLDFASSIETPRATADSVVPVQNHTAVPEPGSAASDCLDADASCKGGFNYTAPSLSHSVSSSSLEVGVVPDGTLNDISTPYEMAGGVFELPTPVAHGGLQYAALDREARVLRYKEKRKNRKFEKTIRYASRKAYAETRPRIKGRFAKRTDADVEQMYASSFIPDSGYGVVPSF